MTVIPDKDIQSALNTTLALAFPTMPIAWENAEYLDPLDATIKAPVLGTPYLRVHLLPAETDVITIGETPWQQFQGIFQVSVLYPINIGFGTPKGKAAEVVAVFKAGTVINYNTLRVICEKVWPSSGMQEDTSWYHIPVNVRYRCESNA
jgi:hypothetical protein